MFFPCNPLSSKVGRLETMGDKSSLHVKYVGHIYIYIWEPYPIPMIGDEVARTQPARLPVTNHPRFCVSYPHDEPLIHHYHQQ
jgi:hypothetical protein